MTSLLKKGALSLALFFSGTPSSVKCTELSSELSKALFEIMKSQKQVALKEQLLQVYNAFFDPTQPLNPKALFFNFAFQETKLEPERIERFFGLPPIVAWLQQCNEWFKSLTTTPSIIVPPLKSSFNVTQDPDLDLFVEKLRTRYCRTSAEAKTTRVRKFLKLTLQWINKTYIKLAHNQRDHFKEIYASKFKLWWLTPPDPSCSNGF